MVYTVYTVTQYALYKALYSILTVMENIMRNCEDGTDSKVSLLTIANKVLIRFKATIINNVRLNIPVNKDVGNKTAETFTVKRMKRKSSLNWS